MVPPPHMFFNHQYQPVMPGYPPHCPWYPPEDAAFYFDGESYVSVGVSTDASGDFKLTLPDAHPDRCGLPDGMPVYLTRDLREFGLM